MNLPFVRTAMGFALGACVWGQTVPIYRVTVIERTAKAVNYNYRSGPTEIDFVGTVLLPKAKGGAMVESRQGRTEIDAHLDGLAAPQRFGSEYLTYVLWAITPEGRPHNIGELIANSSDKVKIHATTDLQAFALIVTAEPYSAVRQPSDVVVAENQIRPDTMGATQPVEAKYELLPRGQYTWHIPANLNSELANAPKVSMHEYEAVSELYQAQNALGIAAQAHAEQYAPDTFARAQQLLETARQLHNSKNSDFRRVVENARQAAQTAEDARTIAQKRQQSEQLQAANSELSRTQAELSNARQIKDQAVADARRAQAEADAASARAQAAMDARAQAERDAAAARESAAAATAHSQLQAIATPRPSLDQRRELRVRIFSDMKNALPTVDTSRGLVATISDDGFRGNLVDDASVAQISRLAAVVSRHPELRVTVEGYADTLSRDAVARDRAFAVRRILIASGVSAGAVAASGLGDSRPVTSQGRRENARIEIVVSGEAIGQVPAWERPNAVTGYVPR